LGIAAEALVILVLGAIDERKGADVLINCLSADATLNAYNVLIAGRITERVRNYLSSAGPRALRAQGRLFMIDRFLEERELTDCLHGADVVWLAYKKHAYMSGVLVLAGIAGLPVISATTGEIGRFVRSHESGVCVDVTRADDIAAGLRRLLDCETRRRMGSRGKKAAAGHTVENFGESVLDAFATP